MDTYFTTEIYTWLLSWSWRFLKPQNQSWKSQEIFGNEENNRDSTTQGEECLLINDAVDDYLLKSNP